MSTNGETADLMVREGIQITESALKLAGLGAKNLAALLIALANDNQKLAGKTNLKRLIHDGEELTIFSVKQEDLKGFQMEAKRYGVLFYPIVNKVEKTGTVEIMAKARDAKQINRIFEILIIFPCFTGIYQINQHGKILFLLRCFVPDICDQGCIIELFRFHPEILRGLMSFPLGVYNDCVYEFQNILFATDISERIVMH